MLQKDLSGGWLVLDQSNLAIFVIVGVQIFDQLFKLKKKTKVRKKKQKPDNKSANQFDLHQNSNDLNQVWESSVVHERRNSFLGH